MQEKATQELACPECHLALFATSGVVLPSEGNALSIECQQSMIGNGHAMGVAAQIAQNLPGSTKGLLGIDDPVLAMQAANQLCELARIGQRGGWSGAVKFLVAVEAFQTGQKFPEKDATEDLHREEERRARPDPTTVVRRESACWNGAVNMGMQQ